MNESQYQQVCQACDTVLRDAGATLHTQATPWLHVIRAHPMFLGQYEDLWNASGGLARARRKLRHFASRARSRLRSLRSPLSTGEPWQTSTALPVHADIVIVSHLLNPSFSGNPRDFYFADLPDRLRAQGHSVVVALIDYTGQDASTLAAGWADEPVPRVIFARSLAPAAEKALQRQALKEAKRLQQQAAGNTGFLRRITERAAEEACGGAALHASRLGRQIELLVSRLSAHTLLSTYEGHAWERVSYAGARRANPDIHCLGYLHAGLFNLQHAALRELAPHCNPDTVLTPGLASQDEMSATAGLQHTAIECIGSSRALKISADEPAGDACLVVPEGDVSECGLLFGFSLECARRLPDLPFLWRVHPNMQFDTLIKSFPELARLPSNVSVSSASLDDDIARARYVLYRGSTAAIQAAAAGSYPVYLHREGEISIDTLYQLGATRGKVCREQDFIDLVQGIPDSELRVRTRQIQAFCRRMFVELDAPHLSAIIAAGKPLARPRDARPPYTHA